MKTIVIYQSKTGFTKKYAEWISEKLSADIFEASEVTAARLTAYDNVIYGGGLYAVGIKGVKLITKNFDKIKDKKVIVFATGVSPVSEEVVSEVKKNNFTSEQQKLIKFFYLRGGFDYRKLGFIDKVIMTLLKVSIKWKQKRNKQLTSDEIGMLAIYDKPTDYTKQNKIDDMIRYVNS
jgi:Flavodoxin